MGSLGSWREEDPLTRVWQLACCALAAVLIFFFRTEVYMTLIGGLTLVGGGPIGLLMSFGFPTGAWFLLAIPFMIIGGLIALACALVAGPPALVLQGLAQLQGTPFQYVGDGVLAVFLGLFFYGFLFPLLWPIVAPVLSHTLGEIAYQRARARVVGDRPRFHRPLFLGIGLICVGAGVGRLFLSADDYLPAKLVTQMGEIRHNLHREVFPPSPTPKIWPKQFTVMPKQTVHTGISLVDKSQEVIVWRNAHVFMRIGDGKPVLLKDNSGYQKHTPFSWARLGEIVFVGGDEVATVQVTEPSFYGRQWLAPGDTQRVNIWHDVGADFWCDCDGDLVYRIVRRGFTSPWRSKLAHIGASGFVEVKANGVAYFTYTKYIPPSSKWFALQPSQVVDTGIVVRRGDLVRIEAAGREPIYFLSPTLGERLIPRKHYIDEEIGRAGTIRVKGGILPSGASITVLSRGPEWK